jgi:protein-S-isoprenylcysteine O-methyltransferase Ste14
VRASLASTSTRTFVLWPALVAAERAARRRPPAPARLAAGAPLLAAGWAAYRACGRYRLGRAGCPPGMSQGMPERLVTTGPYAWSRNPMYAGHLAFLAGLAVATGSPVALAALAWHVPWFARRVRRDEDRLRERFGAAYDEYASRVPRWLPVASLIDNGIMISPSRASRPATPCGSRCLACREGRHSHGDLLSSREGQTRCSGTS